MGVRKRRCLQREPATLAEAQAINDRLLCCELTASRLLPLEGREEIREALRTAHEAAGAMLERLFDPVVRKPMQLTSEQMSVPNEKAASA